MKEKPKRGVVFYGLRLLFSVLVLVLLSELALRCALPGQHWAAKRNVVRVTGGGAVCYPTNRDGYFPLDIAGNSQHRAMLKKAFHPENPVSFATLVEKTPHCSLLNYGKRRRGSFPERPRTITIVGDSFTIGEGVQDQDSLGALIAKKSKTVNVRNWGDVNLDVEAIAKVTGDVLTNHVDAETIIYFYNINDGLVAPGVDRNSHFRIEAFHELPKHFLDPSPWPPVIVRSLRASKIVDTINQILRQKKVSEMMVRGFHNTYFGQQNAENLRRTLSTITAIAAQAKAKNVRFKMVLYPMLLQDSDGQYAFRDVHQLLLRHCKKHTIRCFDGAEAFKDVGAWNTLHVHRSDKHPNEKANRLLVDALVESRFLAEDL